VDAVDLVNATYGSLLFSDPYIILRALAGTPAETVCAYIRSSGLHLYRKLKWRALFTPNQPNRHGVGFADEASPYDASNGVYQYVTGGGVGTYFFTTSAGLSTATNLAEDWSIEHEFDIEWTSTEAKFYQDGVLRATHTTNIPTVECYVTACARVGAVASTADQDVRVKPFLRVT